LCFAAAHVVMRPSYAALGHAPSRAGRPEEIAEHIDLAATMAVRRRIASYGFGIAEAMDTAQRFEIGWPAARQLIAACGALELSSGFVAGAGCDQLADPNAGRAARVDAIVEQVAFIQGAGGAAVLLPQPWLCAQAADAAEAVFVDFEELDVLIDMSAALTDDAPLLFPDAGTNACFRTALGEDDDPLADAEHVTALRIESQRLAGVPIEGNGAVAVPDAKSAVMSVTVPEVSTKVTVPSSEPSQSLSTPSQTSVAPG